MLGPSRIDASFAWPASTANVSVRVQIPWVVMPFVRLPLHVIQAFDGPYDPTAFDRFMQDIDRINSESMRIIDAARYGWRLLTADELRRLDDLHLEREIATATLQRTKASSN